MGIKGLYQYILSQSKDCFTSRKAHYLQHKRVAVDAMIYLYKFNNFNTGSIPLYWTQFLLTLLAFNIHPILVFDSGDVPSIKRNTVEQRRYRRSRQIDTLITLRDTMRALAKSEEAVDLPEELLDIEYSCTSRLMNVNSKTMDVDKMEEYFKRKISQLKGIHKEDLEIVYELNRAFGVEFYIAPEESDKLCAWLYHTERVDFVMSDDSDLLSYQCDIVKDFNIFNHKYTEVLYSNVIRTLGVTTHMFRDMCIMAGTDYSDPIASWSFLHHTCKQHIPLHQICEQKNIPEEDIDMLLHLQDTWLEFDFHDDLLNHEHTFCSVSNVMQCIQIYVDSTLLDTDAELIRKLVYA